MLTTFSDSTCKELGNVRKDNLGDPLVVNTDRELCGAFINNLNVTFVNYTHNTQSRWDQEKGDFNFDLFDMTENGGQQSQAVFRCSKISNKKQSFFHCRSKRVSGNPELMEQLGKNRSLVLGGQDTCQVGKGGRKMGGGGKSCLDHVTSKN